MPRPRAKKVEKCDLCGAVFNGVKKHEAFSHCRNHVYKMKGLGLIDITRVNHAKDIVEVKMGECRGQVKYGVGCATLSWITNNCSDITRVMRLLYADFRSFGERVLLEYLERLDPPASDNILLRVSAESLVPVAVELEPLLKMTPGLIYSLTWHLKRLNSMMPPGYTLRGSGKLYVYQGQYNTKKRPQTMVFEVRPA
jgi:hypothetical protein